MRTRWGWIGAVGVTLVLAMALVAELGAQGTWRFRVPGSPTTGAVVVVRDGSNLTDSFQPAIRNLTTVSATQGTTLTSTDSGRVFVGTKSTTQQWVILPAASTAGLNFCFVAGDASGDLIIDPVGSDIVMGKTHGAENGAAILTTATKRSLVNPGATNVAGDLVCLVAGGSTTWYMTAVAGVWSAEQ